MSLYDRLKRKGFKIDFKKDKVVATSIYNDVYKAKSLMMLFNNIKNKNKIIELEVAPSDPFNLKEFFNQKKS